MRKVFGFVVALILLAASCSQVLAGVKQMNIQGKLTDNSGNPITGV